MRFDEIDVRLGEYERYRLRQVGYKYYGRGGYKEEA